VLVTVPVGGAVQGVYTGGDTVVVLWDGEGTRLDGKPNENTYAWFMRLGRYKPLLSVHGRGRRR
jgi:ketosteroid isomerase-like protein